MVALRVVAGPRRFSSPWMGHRPMTAPVEITNLLNHSRPFFLNAAPPSPCNKFATFARNLNLLSTLPEHASIMQLGGKLNQSW
jgi:hypothetical protein